MSGGLPPITGTSYIETATVYTGLKAAESDSVTSGGPFTYAHNLLVYTGQKAGEVDTVVEADAYIVLAKTGTFINLNPDAPVISFITTSVYLGTLAFTPNNCIQFEGPTVNTGLKALQTDVYTAAAQPNYLYEVPSAYTGLKSGISAVQQIALDTLAARTGNKAALTFVSTYAHTLTVNTGLRSAQVDQLVCVNTPQVKTGQKAAALEMQVEVEAPNAKTGAKCAISVVLLTGLDTPAVSSGSRLVATVGAVAMSASVNMGGKTIAAEIAVYAITPQVKTGLKPYLPETQVMLETVSAKTGGHATPTDSRVVVEIVTTKTGIKVVQADALTMTTTVAVRGGGRLSTGSSAGGLIPAIRNVVRNAGLDITAIVESMSDQRALSELVPNYVVIDAEAPTSFQMAINNAATLVPVTIIYVTKLRRNSVVDTMHELVRPAVDKIIDAIMANWTLSGESIDITLEETPQERSTEYQTRLSSDTQEIVVGMCSFKILVGRQLVP